MGSLASLLQPVPKQVKNVRQFRGISQFKNITEVPMDHAVDLLNVIISSSGALEKFRVPILVANPPVFPLAGKLPIIDRLYDFQQGNGTRQLLIAGGQSLGYYTVQVDGLGNDILPYIFTIIEDNNPLDTGRWDFTTSNNIAFAASSQRMMKWTGANWQNWGIVKPPAPQSGIDYFINAISRAANVASVSFFSTVSGLPPTNQNVINSPIAVFDKNNASFNGVFSIASVGGGGSVTYNNPGPGVGAINDPGTVRLYTQNASFAIGNVQRIAGTTTIFPAVGVAAFSNINVGDKITVATNAHPGMNGTYVVSANNGGLSLSYVQTALVDFPLVADTGTVTTGNTDSGTLLWRWCLVNSVTNTIGPGSDPSPANENAGVFGPNRQYLLTATVPTPVDPQWDAIRWYRTPSNGGDFYFLRQVPLLNPVASDTTYGPGNLPNTYFFIDGHSDDELDFTQRCPLINFAPPTGQYLSKFQGRIFVGGIVGAPQDIAYSGLEQALQGRPEESFFPGNRLRLAVGADNINGFGVIMPGVVAWSKSNQMFMFKGTVEDITTDLPVNFSAILEELPWQTGCASHYSVVSTPYGVVWVASDLTVKVWNGIFYGEIIGPRDLTANLHPLMRRITPGTFDRIQGEFFNFLERDWYACLIAVDGSLTPNRILFFDLSPESQDNLGTFVSNIQADAIGTREDQNGGRHLLISQQGKVLELVTQSALTNGIASAITSTSGSLTAYWESGYLGSDTPIQAKMYRFGQLIADQDGFGLLTKIVDPKQGYTFRNPLVKALVLDNGKFTVNRKGKYSNLTIIFPSDDVSAAVEQLSYAMIPTGDR